MSDETVVIKSSQSETETDKDLHGTTQIVESDESETETETDSGELNETTDTIDNENSLTNKLSLNEVVDETKEQTDTLESVDMETINIDDEEEDEIKHLAKDADREQMIKVYFLFIIEIFKVAMASFLALSVVQNCEGEVCSYDQNVKRESGYGNFVISVNVINVVAFAILYFFEFNREMFLIEYLDIDKRKGDYHLQRI